MKDQPECEWIRSAWTLRNAEVASGLIAGSGTRNSFRVRTGLGARDVSYGREKRAAWRDRAACCGRWLRNLPRERRGGRRTQLKSAASSSGSQPAPGGRSVSLTGASAWAWPDALLRGTEVADLARPGRELAIRVRYLDDALGWQH